MANKRTELASDPVPSRGELWNNLPPALVVVEEQNTRQNRPRLLGHLTPPPPSCIPHTTQRPVPSWPTPHAHPPRFRLAPLHPHLISHEADAGLFVEVVGPDAAEVVVGEGGVHGADQVHQCAPHAHVRQQPEEVGGGAVRECRHRSARRCRRAGKPAFPETTTATGRRGGGSGGGGGGGGRGGAGRCRQRRAQLALELLRQPLVVPCFLA